MKFTCSVVINKPIEELVDLVMDPNNLAHWQDGYEGIEYLSGDPGKVGSKSRLQYKMGKRSMDLIETIEKNNIPHEFLALYEHSHMVNRMQVLFEKLDDETTRYVSNIHYIKFNGFMPKLMARLFPGMFKKQVQKWLDQLKVFAEST